MPYPKSCCWSETELRFESRTSYFGEGFSLNHDYSLSGGFQDTTNDSLWCPGHFVHAVEISENFLYFSLMLALFWKMVSIYVTNDKQFMLGVLCRQTAYCSENSWLWVTEPFPVILRKLLNFSEHPCCALHTRHEMSVWEASASSWRHGDQMPVTNRQHPRLPLLVPDTPSPPERRSSCLLKVHMLFLQCLPWVQLWAILLLFISPGCLV